MRDAATVSSRTHVTPGGGDDVRNVTFSRYLPAEHDTEGATVRKTGLIIAAAALALAACDPGPIGAPVPATLPPPATDVTRLVAAVRAGIDEAPSATFALDAVLGTHIEHIAGSIAFDGRTSSLTMVADDAEVRMIDKRTFTHPPSGVPVPGKDWIGTDPDSTDPIAQAAGAAIPVTVKLPDLGRALAEIDRTGRIVSAEQTRLGDLPVNHYVLELDTAKAPDLFLEFATPRLGDKPATTATAKLPAELWLDAAQRPARFTIDMSAGFAQGGPTRGATDYGDWGTPVDIQPPPAEQVVDLSELMKMMGR